MAGRPRKADKYGGHIAQAEDLIADRLPDLIENLLVLAKGVRMKDVGADGTVEYYTEPPNFKANEYLLNRIMGKPTERHEVTGEDGGPVQVDLSRLPASELEALGRIAERLADERPGSGQAGG